MAPASEKKLITVSAKIIYDGFLCYNAAFNEITNHAVSRFENCDWKGQQQDVVDRVNLYEEKVGDVVIKLRAFLGNDVMQRSLWHAIRAYFGKRLEKVPDAGFIKTFFNSITRRIFSTLGTDAEIEFIAASLEENAELAKALNLKRYPFWGSMEDIFSDVLRDFYFNVPYEESIRKQAIHHIEAKFLRVREYLRLEFIDSFFYQMPRAYLVGRIVTSDSVSPIVIAFRNTGSAIAIDAVLTTGEEVSVIFSYTRSYYFADPNSVVGAVHFLHTILPRKPIDELYTVLGRLRQGKTERHRRFSEHLQRTTDRFIHAEGDKGLVMLVFTLPSYNLVFKVIRDKFGYPKTIARNTVIEKYKLVSKHDRAGRLIDTQEFLNIEFPVHRFADELLEELLNAAARTVKIVSDLVLIKHVYIERRVRPLNLYLKEVSRGEARQAVLDYGRAIKDLAQTNIFPGDLLLKNFGVTHQKRVLFYDYDEVSLVTDCQFRDIPQARDHVDEMRAESWYYVGENDIFPGEFMKFLSMDEELRSFFLETHGDLLTPEYWRKIKSMHEAGEVSPVVPYILDGASPSRLNR